MEDLDSIPWKQLTHAYGSAEDVPEQLRALKTASPDIRGDESPLWELFGNIYHQGTVYEATSYAVPFLLELAADRETPDRIGILELLASIADGTSYHAVHDPFLRAHGLRLGPDAEVERKKRQELEWVIRAHEAVLAGFDIYVVITQEEGDVRYAAANVLSRLRSRASNVESIFRKLYHDEQRSKYRAELLLLKGELGHRSPETLDLLEESVGEQDSVIRWAAAFSLARLDLPEYSPEVRSAIVDTILNEDLYEQLGDLPWDVGDSLDRESLFRVLGEDREDVINQLVSRVESCEIGVETVHDLLNLLFPVGRDAPSVRFENMNSLQLRAVRALVTAMEQGIRIDEFNFFQWGLPTSKRELRNLAAGRPRKKIDISLPLLGEAENPRAVAIPAKLKPGDRIHHRNFGLGTVTATEDRGAETGLTVEFDEEGLTFLGIPSDGSPLGEPENPFAYWLHRLSAWLYGNP